MSAKRDEDLQTEELPFEAVRPRMPDRRMVREMGDGDEMPRRTTRVRDGSCVEHRDVELVELDLLSSLDINK